MKIIKPGRPQKGRAFERTCTGKGNDGGGCGAKLLVEHSDMFQTSSSCMGEVDTFATFECAACGVLTDVDGYPTHDLPKRRRTRG